MKQTNNLQSRIEPASNFVLGQTGLLPVGQTGPGIASNNYMTGYGGGRGGAGSGGMDALKMVRILLQRWITVVLVMIMSGLVGILYTQVATPVYKAKSEVEMSVRRPKVINNDAVFEDSNLTRDTDAIFNTRFAKFKSPAMEHLASNEYLKKYSQEVNSNGEPRIGRYTLASSIREVSWSKDQNANIVYVSCEGSDPKFAARLVNVLSHCAGLLMMQENQALSAEAVKWLISQVEEQRVSLEEVEGQLAEIRKELQLDSLEQRKAALGKSLISVSEEREVLISRLASRKTIYEFVLELKKSDQNLEMLPTGLPKEEQLQELIRGWRTADDQLLLMADRYTDIHPEYRKAAEKESRARARLEQFVELSSRAVENEIGLLEKQVTQMDQRIEAMKSEALELEERVLSGGQRLQRLERKRDAADNAYQGMLRRMEEARLSADENMAYTKVIREAAVPVRPVSPRKIRVLVAALFLGLLAGCGLAVLMELWMDKISSVNDLESLGLNVLGTIPSQNKVDSRGELATIGLRDNFNHLVEIFAGIHSLMTSDNFVEQTKVLLISSVMPGEGKTISSCNLAISSAFNGSRTLLIDGDLRRPQLANIFDIDEAHPSLFEWLSKGENTIEYGELVSSGVIGNLDIITSRPIREINPAELLGRGRLAELIEWASEHYDRIIIDSPPLGPVGDAQVLANLVDSVILVSRVGLTRRRALKFALSRFNEIGTPVFGCVANDVKHSLSGLFGGGEGYAYGYSGSYKSYGRD